MKVSSGALQRGGLRYRRPLVVVGGIAIALVLLLVATIAFIFLFDWNRARPAVQDLLGNLLQREVVIAGLDVDWRASSPLSPVIVVEGLRIGNPSWTRERTMATAELFEFPVTLRMAWDGVRKRPVELPYVRVEKGWADLERDAQGRANWVFKPEDKPDTDEPSRLQVQRLRIGGSSLRYRDATMKVTGEVRFETRADPQWPTHAEGKGSWQGAPFSFTLDAGPLLSLREAGEEFPVRVALRAGATRLFANGRITDLASNARIDTHVDIAGPSLSSLYPTVKLALPATPPYRLSGRLTKQGDRYTFDGMTGTIGRSDLRGSGSYEGKEPRPMLVAKLESRLLDLADLGPVIGVRNAPSNASARTKGQAEAKQAGGGRVQKKSNDDNARGESNDDKKSPTAAAPGGRVLPDAKFDTEKLNSLDADVTLRAHDLRLPDRAPLQDFVAHVKLQGGVLSLEPVTFGLAGGDIVGNIRIDGTKSPMDTTAAVDFRRVQLGKLIPAVEGQAGSGLVGARVRLKGRGDSVAQMLGTSSGAITLGMSGGTVSQLATAAASLNGGKLLARLLGGDEETPIRCAAAALDVQNGTGQITHFVFDTEDVRFNAEGTFDLARERLSVTLRARPKKPSLLSFRAPVYVTGAFSAPSFGVDPKALLRGGAAAALAAVNPFAALLPLIETGPGEDTNCREALAPVSGATREAENTSKAPAQPPSSAAEARKDATRGSSNDAPRKKAGDRPPK